jgi:hypothetical protein
MIALRVWAIKVEGKVVAVLGLSVAADTANPTLVYGACENAEQLDDLRRLLTTHAIPLQIHNETSLPLLNAECSIDPQRANVLVSALPTKNNLYALDSRRMRIALDIVAGSLTAATNYDPRTLTACELPITLAQKVHTQSVVLQSGTTTLTDADQGTELERHTFQLLESLFTCGTYHSPQRDHTKGRLEICDVLALARVCEAAGEGIFVIQNKVAFASADGLNQTSERRALSIQKNILEGINQIVGAVKKLKSGVQVYRVDGSKIEDEPAEVTAIAGPLNLHERANRVGHGIVVVSELHQEVDWRLIWDELRQAAKGTRYCFHVLDLQELQYLVVNAAGRPALFCYLLVERWRRTAKRKFAFTRFEFVHNQGARVKIVRRQTLVGRYGQSSVASPTLAFAADYYEILRRARLYLPVRPDGKRPQFVNRFRSAWLRICPKDRRIMIAWWQKGTPLLDWSPEIELLDFDLIGASAHFGCALHFNLSVLGIMPPNLQEDLIGHELAHTWHFSQPGSAANTVGAQLGAVEAEANALANQWGFQMDALEQWRDSRLADLKVLTGNGSIGNISY